MVSAPGTQVRPPTAVAAGSSWFKLALHPSTQPTTDREHSNRWSSPADSGRSPCATACAGSPPPLSLRHMGRGQPAAWWPGATGSRTEGLTPRCPQHCLALLLLLPPALAASTCPFSLLPRWSGWAARVLSSGSSRCPVAPSTGLRAMGLTTGGHGIVRRRLRGPGAISVPAISEGPVEV